MSEAVDFSHPLELFSRWYNEAKECESLEYANAMCLSTVSNNGMPSSRMVLLKAMDDEGFVFYTNTESQKSRELRNRPVAALCFYWQETRKQIRIEGEVEPVTDAEADAYFSSRPRESQIGACASDQSRPLESREVFKKAIKDLEEKYAGNDVPRPDHWHGWRVIPTAMEFWQERPHRLHHRERYTRTLEGWEMELLYP